MDKAGNEDRKQVIESGGKWAGGLKIWVQKIKILKVTQYWQEQSSDNDNDFLSG